MTFYAAVFSLLPCREHRKLQDPTGPFFRHPSVEPQNFLNAAIASSSGIHAFSRLATSFVVTERITLQTKPQHAAAGHVPLSRQLLRSKPDSTGPEMSSELTIRLWCGTGCA